MSENTLFFLTNAFMIILLTSLQLVLPLVSKRSVLLGVRLPKKALDSREVALLIRKYRKATVLVGGFLLLVSSVFLFFRPDAYLILWSTLLALVLLFLIYWRYNVLLKALKKNVLGLCKNKRPHVKKVFYKRIQDIFTMGGLSYHFFCWSWLLR